MLMKESITSELDELKKELEEYVQIRIDLIKLHIAGEMSRFFSSFMTKTVGWSCYYSLPYWNCLSA